MTNRHLRLEFIGSFAAGILAILLASVIVALAHAPQSGRHHPRPVAKVQQTHHRLVHAVARRTVLRGGPAHRCRAASGHCGGGAKRAAAQMTSRPPHTVLTRRTHQAVKRVTHNKLAVESRAPSAQTGPGHTAKIDAANIALLRVVR
jgi:hypothetical protein